MARLVMVIIIGVMWPVSCSSPVPSLTDTAPQASVPAIDMPPTLQTSISTVTPIAVGAQAPTVELPVSAGTLVPQPLVPVSAETAQQIVELAHFETGMVYEVDWSPDGRLLAVASSQGIHLYDAGTLMKRGSIETDALSVAFSPDGLILASAGGYRDDNTVRLWRVNDGKLLRVLSGHTVPVYSVAFSPDGSILASGSQDETVRIWHVGDGAPLYVLGGHIGVVNEVIFSPDGLTLASASGDQTVRLWRVSDRSIRHSLEGDSSAVLSAAFSPDGLLLASGSLEVRLWQVSDGTFLRTLQEHAGSADSVAFSPDGSLLTSVSDWKVLLWRVSDGALLQTLAGQYPVRSIAFSPNGLTLASGTIAPEGGTVQLWGIKP